MTLVNPDSHASAIIALAEEIAQVAPDCADRALKIIRFAHELSDHPGRATIQDAIEGQMGDNEPSDPQVQSVTSAVVASLRGMK